MIICAAVKLKMNNMASTEHIVCGVRHGDCFKTIQQLNSNWKNASQTEGFMTHTGEFLDRAQAWEYAGKVAPYPSGSSGPHPPREGARLCQPFLT